MNALLLERLGVVQKQTLHPNHHHLLRHILHRLDLDEEYRQSAAGREQDFDAARERTGYDDSGLFLQELPNLGPEEGKMVLALVCLAIVIDANANRASLRFYCSVIEGLSQGDVHYEDNSLHLEELALEFRKGKPLDTGEILDKAVGSAQQSEQLLPERPRGVIDDERRHVGGACVSQQMTSSDGWCRLQQ